MSDKFDIFISAKNLDANGHKTKDSIISDQLHKFLVDKGFRVFSSNISLEKMGIAAYKEAIDDALDNSKILVTIGTTVENLESKWVRYEWDSFFNDILSGVKPDGKVFVYVENIKTNDLPRALRQTQCIEHQQEGFEKLARFVGNAIGMPLKSIFRVDITSGKAPLTVRFKNESNGNPAQFSWNFGDGYISDEQNPSHEYIKPGKYSVKLKISNSSGTSTTEHSDLIEVFPVIKPGARFRSDQIKGEEPFKVSFINESIGNPNQFFWEFGDGNTSLDQNPVHIYTISGTYNVKLIVSNPDGTDVKEKLNYITVLPKRVSADLATFPESKGTNLKGKKIFQKNYVKWISFAFIPIIIVGVVLLLSINILGNPDLNSQDHLNLDNSVINLPLINQNENPENVTSASVDENVSNSIPGVLYIENTNENTSESFPVKNGDSPVEVKWKYRATSYIKSTPVIANNILYIGTGNGEILALNSNSGDLIWKYPSGRYIVSSPTLYKGAIYIGSGNDMFALNSEKGQFIWRYKTSGNIHSSPAASNDTIYFGSGGTGDINIYALKADSGTLIWKYSVGDNIESSPAVYNGILYVGCDDNYLYAINATSGVLLWKFLTKGDVVSSPVISDDTVYFGSRDYNIYALNASSGSLIWRYLTAGKVVSSPAIMNGVIYIGSDDSYLYALDAQTGKIRWKYKGNVFFDTSPAVTKEAVYIGSYDTNLYVLDARSGELLWKFPTGNYIDSKPAIEGNVIFFGSSDKYFYALSSNIS